MAGMFRNPAYRGKQIYHVHIPKCAGDSLVAAVRQQLEPERSHIPNAVALYLAARQTRHCRNEDEFETHQLLQKQAHLLYLMNQNWSFISGHLPYSPLIGRHFGDRFEVVTLLREPLERFISHVVYLIFAQPRTCVEDYASGKVDPAAEVERILFEGIGPWMASNLSLYLGGLDGQGAVDLAGRVAHAIDALEGCALVGFTHQLERFGRAFGERFGVTLSLDRRNTIEEVQGNEILRARARSAFSGSVLARAKELVAADEALYAAACRRFPDLSARD